MQSQKWQNDISYFPRQTIQNHSNLSLCPNHWCRCWSWLVLWRPTTLSRTNTKKDILFIMGLECKSRSQEIPGITIKFSLRVPNEPGQKLPESCQENTMVIANTLFQQPKRQLYTWTSPDGQYRNQIDYVLCSQRWRSSIQSAKTKPGADCCSGHETLLQNSGLNWRKCGKPLGHSWMT